MNAGFVVGEHTTLIVDTGANALAAATIQGYASAVRPANATAVLNTEKHFDHIGGNGYFREQGIDVYGHVGIQRTDGEFRSEFAEFNAAILHPDHPIVSDTQFDLGNCQVQILLTPGHTPTNIPVYVPGDGVLFCGDCLTHRYLPNLDCGTEDDWRQWLRSIGRIEALEPIVIVCGHGPPAIGDDMSRLVGTMRDILAHAIATGRSPTSG